jgi:hypothetical protein
MFVFSCGSGSVRHRLAFCTRTAGSEWRRGVYSCVMDVLDRNAMQDDDQMTLPTTNFIFTSNSDILDCVRRWMMLTTSVLGLLEHILLIHSPLFLVLTLHSLTTY